MLLVYSDCYRLLPEIYASIYWSRTRITCNAISCGLSELPCSPLPRLHTQKLLIGARICCLRGQ